MRIGVRLVGTRVFGDKAVIKGVENDRDLRLIEPKMWKRILQERPYLMTTSTRNHTLKRLKFLTRYQMK